MSVRDLLVELAGRGITIEARGDRLRYSPRSAVMPDLAERMKAHKAALLAMLTGEPCEPEVSHEANEAQWQAISDADRDYLLGPRDWPGPCPWCGGRLVHRAACDELRREWMPIIPFGKYRGRRADELPADYIDWILGRGIGGEDFRKQLTQCLRSN